MKSGYTQLLYKLAIVGVLLICFYEGMMFFGYMPLLTNSVSFDAKIYAIKKQHPNKVQLMALGSSITLDNLSSDIITHSEPSYYNFSSWGLEINDIRAIFNIYNLQYAPKCFLICSSFPDFRKAGNADAYVAYLNTGNFIKNHAAEYFYIKNYNPLPEIFARKKEYQKDTADILKFDKYGGIQRRALTADTLMSNWLKDFDFPNNFTAFQYAELKALAKDLQQKHIRMVFVQSPVQQRYTTLAKNSKATYAHIKTCQAIIENNGGIYVNYYQSGQFADSLFVDPFHLSANGAKILTRRLVAELKLHKVI